MHIHKIPLNTVDTHVLLSIKGTLSNIKAMNQVMLFLLR